MTDLIIRMLRVFLRRFSDLCFSTGFVENRGGGFINFIFVVLGVAIFVYMLRRLIRGYR